MSGSDCRCQSSKKQAFGRFFRLFPPSYCTQSNLECSLHTALAPHPRSHASYSLTASISSVPSSQVWPFLEVSAVAFADWAVVTSRMSRFARASARLVLGKTSAYHLWQGGLASSLAPWLPQAVCLHLGIRTSLQPPWYSVSFASQCTPSSHLHTPCGSGLTTTPKKGAFCRQGTPRLLCLPLQAPFSASWRGWACKFQQGWCGTGTPLAHYYLLTHYC